MKETKLVCDYQTQAGLYKVMCRVDGTPGKKQSKLLCDIEKIAKCAQIYAEQSTNSITLGRTSLKTPDHGETGANDTQTYEDGRFNNSHE